jgi:hypothetical protein
MPGTKERPYRQASVPADLMRRVEWTVQTFPELGYQTPTELIRECIRRGLREMEDELERHIRIAEHVKGKPKAFLRLDEARRPLNDD